jgi:RNA polymerase sigma-70 factor (ECF subfamily)
MNDDLVRRLYGRAQAERWSLTVDVFRDAIRASADAKDISARDLEKYAASLHLEDLALACACAAGNEAAWEYFIHEQRPVLYRAADALDPTGGARELADSLYADLYGLRGGDDGRRSLFRYFHGRSSLSTWLRAVLAQRHVDRVRSVKRFSPLPDEEAPTPAGPSGDSDPDRTRYLGLMQQALGQALERLPARDRLRLGCYYVQDLTLAETGRVLRESEATVSRQLARTRRALRQDVEHYLRAEAGFSPDDVARCFESTAEDAGPLDLRRLLRDDLERKIPAPERSMDRESL